MTASTRAPSYPLVLDLAGRRVLVVGGGPVAARRATALVAAGAVVEVVAPWLCEPLAALVADRAVTWHPREYADGDIDGAWLVHTATGEPGTDAAVASAAEAARVWCVRADDAGSSAAWTPAVARAADGVLVAVSGGGDPGRARALRDAVAAALDTGTLPLRATRPRRATGPGTVHLVGGGPGDAGLLTVRGRRLLALADVVVVDRLAPRGVLEELGPHVEVVDCGKAPGHHQLTQDEINDLLVDRALRGLDVVRLKGGDPFVLGRGGEEALACRAAGVPVEVVPGVTSAVSVPAAAGIPVTHRGIASSFALVSAHDGIAPVEAAAAQHPASTTLVLLMGVRLLRDSATALVRAGRDATTPVAVVERGWTSRQRTTVGTLADIADLAAARAVESPAVVVVGDVVRLRATLGAFADELS
ncbi:MAG: uroporphyrinogen-III C-methyltransferase [Frankiales bacterium]|nr:uroporphyrinogen-III C-methyltransferase [Frankiales bacterium]